MGALFAPRSVHYTWYSRKVPSRKHGMSDTFLLRTMNIAKNTLGIRNQEFITFRICRLGVWFWRSRSTHCVSRFYDWYSTILSSLISTNIRITIEKNVKSIFAKLIDDLYFKFLRLVFDKRVHVCLSTGFTENTNTDREKRKTR